MVSLLLSGKGEGGGNGPGYYPEWCVLIFCRCTGNSLAMRRS